MNREKLLNMLYDFLDEELGEDGERNIILIFDRGKKQGSGIVSTVPRSDIVKTFTRFIESLRTDGWSVMPEDWRIDEQK